MALNDIVKSGVALANSITSSLQGTVKLEAWTSNSGAFGKPLFATGILISAIIDDRITDVRLPNGETVTQHASVTFLSPISPNGAVGRREPIDPRDRITLPSGYVGRVLTVNGLDNPGTGLPYLLEVSLG